MKSAAKQKELRDFLLGEPVSRIRSGRIRADKTGTAIQNAQRWGQAHAELIQRRDMEAVVFSGGTVRDSLSHRFGQKKLDAVQAIPEGIRKGKVISMSADFFGKPKMHIILAAPVHIDDQRNILCMRLVKNIGDRIRFHVHEVFDMETIKNTAIPFQTPGTGLTACPRRGIAIYLTILRNILDVK